MNGAAVPFYELAADGQPQTCANASPGNHLIQLAKFLENSFKHGLNNHLTKGFVNMRLLVDNNQVHFYIENSKPDTPPKQDSRRPSGGIGLVNIHRRLNLLYPNQYQLDIEDSPKAYAVNLQINLDN